MDFAILTQQSKEENYPLEVANCLFSESSHEPNFKIWDTLKPLMLEDQVELIPTDHFFETKNSSAVGALDMLF